MFSGSSSSSHWTTKIVIKLFFDFFSTFFSSAFTTNVMRLFNLIHSVQCTSCTVFSTALDHNFIASWNDEFNLEFYFFFSSSTVCVCVCLLCNDKIRFVKCYVVPEAEWVNEKESAAWRETYISVHSSIRCLTFSTRCVCRKSSYVCFELFACIL